MLHDLLGDEVVDKELVVLKEFFEQVELALLVALDYVVEDELEPLRHVHLEESVVSDELVDDLVESVVQLKELLPLVVLVGEDVLDEVLLHEVEQFKEEFADA